MSLYPSLEDMKVDQMARAQYQAATEYAPPPPAITMPLPYSVSPSAPASFGTTLYPTLNEFMGLELSQEVIAQNMPEYAVAVPAPREVAVPSATGGPLSGMIAPLSGQSLGLKRAQVTHGVRELTLCKDSAGKVGVRVKAIDKGVFVCLVTKGSPAALAGLRFGDQILQINGTIVAGFSMDQVHDLFRKSPVNGISVVVRDRPFERTVTLHKDSVGRIGFQFKNGKIIAIVKDSSAARNGLLIEHYLLEVNGQNVVGLKDKEITNLIEEGGQVVTVTIMPAFVYEHMVKKMSTSLLKGSMDHSIPDV
ncbi:syntenin-1-like [Schistocerca gregaria]|uniref:syntenin-1-like n=1 Tax=Schistocerca gregaria TaxID=7010 RepID=UPI00211E77E7|nr:syntenin-1-like [Schistocerca gregaria]XP_049858904.1 syntenin-1-like [Schistocerca gregaria]